SYSQLHLLSFFFLSSPRPPSSTLFPYTTLFRSVLGRTCAKEIARVDGALPTELPVWDESQVEDADEQVVISHNWDELPTCSSASDRKSTRLNSSHVAISYAVFCLKKKKKEKTK